MKKVILIVLSAVLISCGDRVKPSGNIISMERETGDFVALEIHSGIRAAVILTDTPGMTVIADDNIIPYIDTYKNADTLIVKVGSDVSIKGDATLRVAVQATSLTDVSAFDGSFVEFPEGIYNNEFNVKLSGGSQWEGEIRTGKLDIQLNGGSDFTTMGSAAILTLNCSGASEFNWGKYDFLADAVEKATLSGGSKVALTVGTALNATASGGSRLYYKGNPETCLTTESGGSTILQVVDEEEREEQEE